MPLPPNDLTDPDAWWTEYSGHYVERTWRFYRPLLAEFIAHAEGGPLLDVGCGYGFLTECARQFGITAIGLEGSEQALVRAKRLHPLADLRTWKGGDPLPIASGSVGGAILNEFIDHITLEQNQSLFGELARVLKPGGLLLVKSPSKFNRFDKDRGHVTFFSPSEFRRFTESFSFDVIAQPYVPQPLLGKSRIGSFAMKIVTRFHRPEKWAARIDLIASRRA